MLSSDQLVPKPYYHQIRRDSDYFNTTGAEKYKECIF